MRQFISIFAIAAAAVASLPAHAVVFTYDWNGSGSTGGGSFGTGSITFDAGVSDTSNFSGLTLANITSLSYTWNNGTLGRAISYDSSTISSLFANNTISAVNGVLSNVVISDFPFNSFALSIAPSTMFAVGVSGSSSVSPLDADQGAWRLAAPPIPEPGTWALMLAGGCAVFAFARRSQRARMTV